MKGKKFLKILLIIIIVAGAIGGTCWFFFAQFKKETESYKNAIDFQYSGEREEIYSLLQTANTNSGIDKFAQIAYVLETLDDLSNQIIPYLIKAEEYDLDSDKIYSRLEDVTSMHASIIDMLEEYNTKATKHLTFDKNSGANPLYTKLSNYIVNYAEYFLAINEGVLKIANNKNVTKFYVIDVYLNITINTFSNLTKQSGVIKIKSYENLELAQTKLYFNNTNINYFSANAALFRKEYSKCDKSAFAANFKTKYNSIAAPGGNANDNAMYYLKNIMAGV